MMNLSKRALFISFALHLLMILALVNLIRGYSLYSLPVHPSIQTAYLVMKTQLAPKPPAPTPIAIPISPLANTPTATPAIAKSQPATPSNSEVSVTQAEPLAPAQIQQLLLIVSRNIQEHLHYPSLAATHTEQGQSLLQFDLNAQGDLQNVELVQSSGIPSLDEAALQAIAASSPIEIPTSIKLNQSLTLRLPVNFKMQA